MNARTRYLLTYAVLAVYGVVSLVGQGLHLLSDEHGLHVGGAVIECATHHGSHGSADCIYQHAGELAGRNLGADAAGPVIRANGCVAHTHTCDVCEFLTQARSAPPQAATTAERAHVTAVAFSWPQTFYVPISLRAQAPRGPPTSQA